MFIPKLVSQGAETQTRGHLFYVKDASSMALDSTRQTREIVGGALPIPSAPFLLGKLLEEAREKQNQQLRG